jgi:pimeloyl-ACP methyl ester carboxylesterase
VIFLPGGPGVVRMAWARVARTMLWPLAAQGCTVWRLARRHDMPSGHTLEDMADDVAQVIDDAFDGHVDAVVGASMGGLIALFLAARHDDAMSRVVLVSAAAVPTDATVRSTRRFGEALGHGRFTAAAEASLADAMPGRLLWPVRRLASLPLGRVLASSGNNLPDVLVETEAVMAVDARPVLPLITAPVLVIVGDNDSDFSTEMVDETVRLIPDCTLVRYEGRGHAGAIWDPRTPAEILDFVRAA